MSLGGLNQDFADLLAALCDEGVEFLIVGAYAMAFHGVPRMTGDIDILVRPEAENAERARRALAAFGAPLEGLAAEDLAAPDLVFQIGLPPRRIDLMTSISGVSFDEAWATREPATLGARTVHFIGRDALARNKRAIGRPKDLVDLELLERR